MQGPVNFDNTRLELMEERYKLIGYADNVKPAITTMHEFILVDRAMSLFERASGCKLHRDTASKKSSPACGPSRAGRESSQDYCSMQ